jgi:hypothetical protein
MIALAISTAVAVSSLTAVLTSTPTIQEPVVSSVTLQTPILRGIHMTGWSAGYPKARRNIIEHMKASGLNMVVIALKESDGRVFVRDVPEVKEIGSYTNAIPDLSACVQDFKQAGIYTVARLALFKDNTLARKRMDWAVRRPNGALWLGKGQAAWADPYRKEVWDYNLAIAEGAAKAGFDEIQFDYVRFPSDGPINLCRYSRADHTPKTSAADLVEFLAEAAKRLHPLGVKISIDVFGQTTTDDTGMGIGQHISLMADKVDYVCPMMYPSHYYRGVYGIKDPNRDPYRTIHRALGELAGPLRGLEAKVRPYLQDFSLGHHYGPKEVRDQIFAAARMGVTNWTLWNPGNHYTWSAIPEASLIETVTRSAAQEEHEDAAAVSSTSATNVSGGARRP